MTEVEDTTEAASADERRTTIAFDFDVVAARQHGRALAAAAGFTGSELTVIATAISEVARNIVSYAGTGEICISIITDGRNRGVAIVARDSGPGIADVEKALQDGFSTGRSLGLGLPGSKRLMDEFEIVSEVGSGTTVSMKKWVRSR
jgi:serine/threonine-protein kinase RsbT